MKPTNYIEDLNPFHMAAPPAWWLEGIRNVDDQIVVFPSRERFGWYWLTRRVTRQALMTDAAVFSPKVAHETQLSRSDTAMFLKHRVERVIDICTPLGHWSLDKTLSWLRENDTWAIEGGPLDEAGLRAAVANGGSKYTKHVEGLEAADRARQKRDQRERIHHATGDGWRSLQARKGQRILNAGQATRPQLAGV